MKIPVKKLSETAKVPVRGSDFAAGYDISADIEEDITLMPRMTRMISSGIAIQIPKGYFGAVFARSGLASKEGLRPANCVGVIDADYRGELKVPLYNDSDTPRVISPGQKIAQLVVIPFERLDFEMTDELSETDRMEDGFGSTGR